VQQSLCKKRTDLKLDVMGATMTDTGLAKLSLDDLWTLHEWVCSMLEKRLMDEKLKLDRRLDKLGRKFGETATDVAQRRPNPKVEPKFRHPEDPSRTWSGRGRQPQWVVEFLSAGRAIDDFRILETA
jgi:DNA-binding protein H-NS